MYDEDSNATAATLVALNNASATAAAMAAAAAATSSTAATAASSINSSQQLMNQLLNVKDSRWLQLEVCREFQRGQCSRSDQECKFAHPPPHVDIQNGRVTACYDSIKGRCIRENPRCKYLHPPQHLKDQLLINGRNNLALKNMICSQLSQSPATSNLQPLALMQQQPTTLVQALPFQYFSHLPTAAALYPTLISAAANGTAAAPLESYQLQTGGANGVPPMKRPTMDKGGVVAVGTPTATATAPINVHYATAAAPFNPYIIQQIPAGPYMPAVTYGQLPPRF